LGAERRRTPRYPFAASAEIKDEKSGAHAHGRMNELGLYGCYVEMANPFLEGTPIRIKLSTETDWLETRAVVVYSHPGRGIGVKFLEMRPYSMIVLHRWLLKAMAEKQKSADVDSEKSETREQSVFPLNREIAK